MKHFNNVTSLEDLKKQYRKLALANHPDKGGRTEVMQEINIEFDVLFKIWKDRIADNAEQPTSETASEYRRNFYTANGWEGSRYDNNLSTKDVAAMVREYVKMQWPQYKFSIRTQYYSGGSAIHLTLVSGPEKAFKDGATRTYISTMRNVEGFEKDLTEIVFHVMSDVCDFMQSYNYDDSDGMIDYFDTNFYSHVYVGDWNKPYQVVAAKKARVESSKEPEQKDNTTTPELEIVDYSEKAVAVFSDTKTIKDELKSIGGKFNPRLNYNGGKRAGWVFPKSKREELDNLIHDTGTNDTITTHENDNKTITEQPNDKEERTPMNPADFMAFISCVQKRAIENGYSFAREYVKDMLQKHVLQIAQLKYIAVLLSEYKERNGNNSITRAA